MRVIPPSTAGRLLACLLLSLLAACGPRPLDNPYRAQPESSRSQSGPVAELHKRALAALDAGQQQQAIDYLQRAIKIQPRNGWSWHYLAQSYWLDGQSNRCLAMLDRSSSYSQADELLASANQRLQSKCQG